METIQEMTLVGYYHFASKDKTKHFYVVQALSSKNDVSNSNYRSTICDIFVSEEMYNSILNREIGTLINVQVEPNLSTGKINFKICL